MVAGVPVNPVATIAAILRLLLPVDGQAEVAAADDHDQDAKDADAWRRICCVNFGRKSIFVRKNILLFSYLLQCCPIGIVSQGKAKRKGSTAKAQRQRLNGKGSRAKGEVVCVPNQLANIHRVSLSMSRS